MRLTKELVTSWLSGLIILVFVATGIAGAQIVKGTIVGTVRDASGAAIPNAKVSAKDVATAVTTASVTDTTGSYEIPLLNPGTYTVKIEHSGFKTAVETNFALGVAAKVRIDVTLQVGDVAQRVEVSSVAPMVETDSTTVGLVVTTSAIAQLPLLGRNYQALAQLAPTAVTPIGSIEVNNTPGISVGGLYQASGQRGNYNSYTIDGIGTQQVLFQMQSIIPSLDSIQEFKLQTHNFSAEYGTGAVQFTVSTKNGTNQVHGSAYEYVQNDILNASSFFANRSHTTKVPFRYNQFGGTFGGPVVVPKIFDGTNKTFFFFAYEGTRLRNLANGYATVPDSAWLKGDFSGLKNTNGTSRLVYDPATVAPNGLGGFTRTAFPGNVIPSNRINSVAAALIPFIPAPNGTPGIFPGTANYTAPAGVLSDVDYWALRIDHHFNSNDSLYGRYMQSIEDYQQKALLPLSGTVQQNHGHNVMVSETHVFSRNVVNELRIGYNRALNYGIQDGGNGPINYVQDVFHLQNIGGGPKTYGLPSFTWTGFTGTGGNVNQPFAPLSNTYQLTDNLITSFGRHSIRAGVDLRKAQFNMTIGTFNRGSFAFSGQYTAATPNGTASSGNPFADFLLGLSTDVRGLSGEASGEFHEFMQNYYVQDDWRATSKLTLNLGMRYEYYSPWTEKNGRATVMHLGFAPGTCFGYSCPPATLEPSEPGKPFYNANPNDWAPRVGLAYSPFGNATTTIRAAYGFFYTPPAVTDLINSVLNPPTTVNTEFQPSNLSTDLTTTLISKPFPTATITRDTPLVTNNWPLPGISLYSVLPNEPDAIVQQWQMTIQHELIPNLVVEAGYVGSHGYNGQRRIGYNLATPPANPSNPTPLQSRLPYPALSPLTFIIEHSAQSTYHAGTMRVEKRFRKGFSFVSSYTFSKSIDDYGNVNDPTGFWAQNPYNKKAEKGLSAFDARQRLTIGYVYELPFGRGKYFGGGMNPVLNGIVGGWQLSGINTFQSGNPLGLVSSQDFSQTGNTLVHRPNQVAAVHYLNPTASNLQWFDPSSFANPAPGTFGDASRGAAHGPGIDNWDMTFAKYLPLVEKARLQFRVELYNAFNHTQFAGVASTLASPTAFGKVTTTRAPRNSQLALRLEF